jgi:hypothetical protein
LVIASDFDRLVSLEATLKAEPGEPAFVASGLCAVLSEVRSRVLDSVVLRFDPSVMASLPPSEWERIDSALAGMAERAPLRVVRVEVRGEVASDIEKAAVLPRTESTGLLHFQVPRV